MRTYEVSLYENGKADIAPEQWWGALVECCREVANALSSVELISFSVTTPGLVPMAEDGTALGPAILFLDNRAHKQACAIREVVGEDVFLNETCNLPVSGGSSLASMLWIREQQPEVWNTTFKFGHCNTYMVRRFTGEWAIDPSTTSITGLYNTAKHDLTWNSNVLRLAGISEEVLPPLRQSHQKVGQILPEIARELNLPTDCTVLCGGNDAVLAALSGQVWEPGEISYIAGTCEIIYVCIDRPVASSTFNVRCHVIPHRWLTFFVLNTGGKALDWFHSVFCKDMSLNDFYNDYLPSVLNSFLVHKGRERPDLDLPDYVPFLQGSRYSTQRLTAAFSGLSLETTREKMLLGLLRGNALYQREHLKEVAGYVKLNHKIITSGGAAKIAAFLEAKRLWTGDFDFVYRDQSSLLGAAMLGRYHLTGEWLPEHFNAGGLADGQ